MPSRLVRIAAPAVALAISCGGAAAETSFRIDGGQEGQLLVTGSFPRARGCLWAMGRGAFAATETLDLVSPDLGLEEALAIESLAKSGVAVRVVAGSPVPPSESRDLAVRSALGRLARVGVKSFLSTDSAARGGFALADRSRVVVPTPFVAGEASHALAAEAADLRIAELFAKRFEELLAGATEVSSTPDGPTLREIWPSADPSAGARTLCGTTGTSGRTPYPPEVVPVFRLADAQRALDLAVSNPSAPVNPDDVRLTLYVGSDGFVSGRATEMLPSLLEPVLREWRGRIRSVVAVVAPSVEKAAVESWIRDGFPGSRITLIREEIPVQSGFALFTNPGTLSGVAFVGRPEAGFVLVGWNPVSERDLPSGTRPRGASLEP